MTKRDIVMHVSTRTGLTQAEVHQVLDQSLDMISRGLGNNEHVELREFGVFDVVIRKSRVGRNPKRPTETVIIPDRKVVKFKAGKTMRERLLAGPAA